MTNDLIPQSMFRFPVVSFPTLIDEIEDLLPYNNLLDGLTISEDDKNIFVEAAVPGVDPKYVDVTFSKDLLTIKAEKKEEEKGKTFQRKATRSFFYRVAPGINIDTKAEPQAVCKNGVMTVTFAKTAEAKPKKIAVKAV